MSGLAGLLKIVAGQGGKQATKQAAKQTTKKQKSPYPDTNLTNKVRNEKALVNFYEEYGLRKFPEDVKRIADVPDGSYYMETDRGYQVFDVQNGKKMFTVRHSVDTTIKKLRDDFGYKEGGHISTNKKPGGSVEKNPYGTNYQRMI